MEKKMILVLVVILTLTVFIAGCVDVSDIMFNNASNSGNASIPGNLSANGTPQIEPHCNKEENCCMKDGDCWYAWFTGGCNTPEYVSKRHKEAEEKGILIGEAPPRENVTCTCEDSVCITHG